MCWQYHTGPNGWSLVTVSSTETWADRFLPLHQVQRLFVGAINDIYHKISLCLSHCHLLNIGLFYVIYNFKLQNVLAPYDNCKININCYCSFNTVLLNFKYLYQSNSVVPASTSRANIWLESGDNNYVILTSQHLAMVPAKPQKSSWLHCWLLSNEMHFLKTFLGNFLAREQPIPRKPKS